MTAPDLTLQLDQALNRLSSGAAWDRVAPAVDDSLQPYLAAFAALKQAFDLEEARPEFRLALRARLVGQVEAAPQPRTISSALRRAAAFAAATLLLGSAASPALAAELFDHVKQTLGEPVANLLQEAIEQSSSFVQDHAHEDVPDEQVAGLSAVAGAGAPRWSENPMQPLVPVVGEVAAMAPPVSLIPNPPAPASLKPAADAGLELPSETVVHAPPAVAELPAEPGNIQPAPSATVVSSAPVNKDTPPPAVTSAAPVSVPGGVALPSVAGAPGEDQPLSSDMALPPASPRQPADAGKQDVPATVEPVAAAAQSQSDTQPAPVVPPTGNNPGKSEDASPPKGPPSGTPGSANSQSETPGSSKPANLPITPVAEHPVTPANRPSRGPANVPGVAATPASPNAAIPTHATVPGKEGRPGKAKDLPAAVPAHAAAAESPAANPAKAEGRPSEAPGHAASGGHAASSNASAERPANPAAVEQPAHPAASANTEGSAHRSEPERPVHPANPAETAAPSANLPGSAHNPSEEHQPASPKAANAAAAEGKPSRQNAAPEVNPGAGAGKSGAKGAGK